MARKVEGGKRRREEGGREGGKEGRRVIKRGRNKPGLYHSVEASELAFRALKVSSKRKEIPRPDPKQSAMD